MQYIWGRVGSGFVSSKFSEFIGGVNTQDACASVDFLEYEGGVVIVIGL